MDSSKVSSFVTVALAEDLEHARHCQRMLREKSIEAIIKPNDPMADSKGVPVLVPQELAIRAKEVLTIGSASDDFCYFGFDDAADGSDQEE